MVYGFVCAGYRITVKFCNVSVSEAELVRPWKLMVVAKAGLIAEEPAADADASVEAPQLCVSQVCPTEKRPKLVCPAKRVSVDAAVRLITTTDPPTSTWPVNPAAEPAWLY